MVEYFFSHYFHYGFYFLLSWLLILLYHIGLFTEIGTTLRENKLFFFFIILVFGIIPLCNSPFNPLVYFDEHNYILSAQNIIENGVNAICAVDSDGQCQKFNIAPHGLGVGAVYAMLYNSNFEVFYRKIALFNLFLYLLNAIFMFIIASRVFSNKTVSKGASVLVLLIPFNMIYATTAMPATISNTFFLISIYCFIRLTKFRMSGQGGKDILNNNYWITLFCALAILSIIRLEYCLLFQAFLLMLLCSNEFLFKKDDFASKKTPYFTKAKILQLFQYFSMLSVAVIIYSFANLYIKMKAFTLGGGEFGLGNFNGSYVSHYFMNVGFWFLSILFVCHFIRHMVAAFNSHAEILRVTLFSVFIVFLTIYSFYSFESIYRFLIPITSIYLLMASFGMYVILKALVKDERRVWGLTFLCLIVLGILFIKDGVLWKTHMILREKHNEKFVTMIESDNLNKFARKYEGSSFFYFQAPYLGQMTRLYNYSDNYSLAIEKLKEGANLFYIDSPFQQLKTSPFNNPTKFIVYKENDGCVFGIYKISIAAESKQESYP